MADDDKKHIHISDILQNVKDGAIEPSDAAKLIISNQKKQQESATTSQSPSSSDDILTSFATLDYNRSSRTGFPEVVFGANKTPKQIATILDDFARHINEQMTLSERATTTMDNKQKAVLATRYVFYIHKVVPHYINERENLVLILLSLS